jgi:hypothetical protein
MEEDDPGELLNAWLGELDSLQKVGKLSCQKLLDGIMIFKRPGLIPVRTYD